MASVSDTDYRSLAAFRYEIRKFLAFSEKAARAAGVEPQQHQMLLAIRGLPASVPPTIGAVAERLCIRHHSAVALADALEALGYVQRQRSELDRRKVLLHLTDTGEALMRTLSALHQAQLRSVGPGMVSALQAIIDPSRRRR